MASGLYKSEYHFIIKTKFYRAWASMKARCNNKKDIRYGGRGITFSKNWKSFSNFFRDMYFSFSLLNNSDLDISLDRIDNNKGYSKDNCRWTTREQQANNRCSRTKNNPEKHYLTYKGEKRTLSKWSKKLNINRSTLAQRYYVYNWSVEKCLTY